jgi:hypothetical protein
VRDESILTDESDLTSRFHRPCRRYKSFSQIDKLPLQIEFQLCPRLASQAQPFCLWLHNGIKNKFQAFDCLESFWHPFSLSKQVPSIVKLRSSIPNDNDSALKVAEWDGLVLSTDDFCLESISKIFPKIAFLSTRLRLLSLLRLFNDF